MAHPRADDSFASIHGSASRMMLRPGPLASVGKVLGYALGMSSRAMQVILAAALLGAGCAVRGQSPPDSSAAQPQKAQEPLPSLPSGPTPSPVSKPLVLPKTSGPITLYSSRPQDTPPPAPPPEDEDSYCSTPTATAYRTTKPVSAEGQKAAALYMRTVEKQIWTNWKPPREINDPWLKGAVVRIKFEILPDGSLSDPIVMMSSGRASYDRRALESIKYSAPFGPPPPNGPVPFRVCYRFSYNMNREDQDTMPVDVFAKKPRQP